jgi:uncharacterized membrane protein YkvA (DUF1232 family)
VQILSIDWQKLLRYLKREAYTLYYACGDRRCPWYAKLLGICIVAYAFSPIDLIPDFIPVIGYLDDLLIIPIGVFLFSKLIPKEVMTVSRQKAKAAIAAGQDNPQNWMGAAAIVGIWLLVAGVGIYLYFHNPMNTNKK